MDNRKVLIVDDQNGIRLLLSELLCSEGYSIYQAANGRFALDLVQQHQPDLVLLDMKIPGMDGLEILRQIKQKHPEMKVIMMTAYGELNMLNEARELGALMHFTKPFDIDELKSAVNTEMNNAFTM